MNGLVQNYHALCVSILANVPPEMAFYRLGADIEGGDRKKKPVYTDTDLAEMDSLRRQGWTLKKVGEAYGLNSDHVCRIVGEWRRAHG